TAEPDNLDNTLKSVKRIATYNGFDGWLMLNVYPQRATNPNDLDAEINNELRLANTKHICTAIQELNIETIWVAYGDLIDSRNYLPFCMADIFKELGSDLNWKIIGVPTKKGHPRHPLYKPTKSKLVDFNMEHYVTEKLRQLNLEGIV
ncbi:MAG: DUF1643 domain-containing protein, partial [Bacteroidia bacterium]|nr:DUF1643 domain-containing protein [Bacteroidia bacterium]